MLLPVLALHNKYDAPFLKCLPLNFSKNCIKKTSDFFHFFHNTLLPSGRRVLTIVN